MTTLERFQQHHLKYEIIAILLYFLISANLLASSVVMEGLRNNNTPNFDLWEPYVWEYTSALSWLLILLPITLFVKKHPWQWQQKLNSLIKYFVASFIVSISHISLMVGLRKLSYWLVERHYDFGNISYEFIYEYRKDLWSFLFILTVYHSYGFIRSRILGEAESLPESEDEAATPCSDRLLVKKLGKEFLIKINDIEWLEASGNYVNLHIKERIYPIRSTLSALIEQIADKGFSRIHRSFAVNLEFIESITPIDSGDSEIKLKNGKHLNLSRRYKAQFKQDL